MLRLAEREGTEWNSTASASGRRQPKRIAGKQGNPKIERETSWSHRNDIRYKYWMCYHVWNDKSQCLLWIRENMLIWKSSTRSLLRIDWRDWLILFFFIVGSLTGLEDCVDVFFSGRETSAVSWFRSVSEWSKEKEKSGASAKRRDENKFDRVATAPAVGRDHEWSNKGRVDRQSAKEVHRESGNSVTVVAMLEQGRAPTDGRSGVASQ